MKRGYIPINEVRKSLYTIGQAEKLTGCTPRMLRWYEVKGLLLRSRRSLGRRRLYTELEIKRIKEIKELRDAGIGLLEIKKKLPLVLEQKTVMCLIDSTLSVAPEQVFDYGAHIVPMQIKFGKEVYADGVQISAETYVAVAKKKWALSSSASQSVAWYKKYFLECLQEAEQIISFHADSRIVSSYDAACAAVKELGAVPVKVVDTKLMPLGFNLIFKELMQEPLKYKKVLSEAQKHVLEFFVLNSNERFALDNNPVALMVSDCVPVLQHAASDGFKPVGRFANTLEAENYIDKQVKKYDRVIRGDSKGDGLKYSAVVMSNLAQDISGKAFWVL